MIDTISLIRLAIIILSSVGDDSKKCIFSHIAEKDINWYNSYVKVICQEIPKVFKMQIPVGYLILFLMI